MTDHGFETLALHAGQEPDPLTGSVVPPIYQVSTYAQDGVGGLRNGYEYSRSGNPTRHALEQCLAALEAGTDGFAFASGLAAEDTLLRAVCAPGDHVVIPDDAYGGTYRLFAAVMSRWGVEWTSARLSDVESVRAAMRPNTRVLWVETPTNPLLNIADIAALADVAHAGGALLAVDNTFASPYLCTPAGFGFDYVLHSATKYIGGHSDLIGGVVCCSEEQMEGLRSTVIETGGTLAPLEAWLCMRGLATLELRMVRHTATASSLASFLEQHPKVQAVHHPSLTSHPQHAVAQRLLPKGSGGMLAFEVAGGVEAGTRFCDAVELAWVAASLGGVHTLVGHAASTTHRQMDAGARRAAGIADGLIRVSVGLEDPDDIVRDFAGALEKA